MPVHTQTLQAIHVQPAINPLVLATDSALRTTPKNLWRMASVQQECMLGQTQNTAFHALRDLLAQRFSVLQSLALPVSTQTAQQQAALSAKRITCVHPPTFRTEFHVQMASGQCLEVLTATQ